MRDIISACRLIAIAGVICSTLLFGNCRAEEAQPAQSADQTLQQSVKHFLQTSDDGKYKTESYVVAFPDLNGDGKPEAIVYLTGREWCGSGGCRMLVLTQTAHHSWRIVSSISVTHRPISVLTSTSHGWHSIGVLEAGGGILDAYEAELRFNGKKYPFNPSMPPAIKLSKPVPEEVVIPEPPLTGAQKAKIGFQ